MYCRVWGVTAGEYWRRLRWSQCILRISQRTVIAVTHYHQNESAAFKDLASGLKNFKLDLNILYCVKLLQRN